MLALADPPARGGSQKIEDDGNAAQAILDFLNEKRLAVKTLVFVEHHGGELQKGSLGVLAKAASLGGDVGAVLVGAGVKALAPEVARYGATTVHVAEDAALDPPLPQPRVDVLATVVARRRLRHGAVRELRARRRRRRRDSRRVSTPD